MGQQSVHILSNDSRVEPLQRIEPSCLRVPLLSATQYAYAFATQSHTRTVAQELRMPTALSTCAAEEGKASSPLEPCVLPHPYHGSLLSRPHSAPLVLKLSALHIHSAPLVLKLSALHISSTSRIAAKQSASKL